MMQVVRGAWAMLTKNTGSVRVDFAQPFSLQVHCVVITQLCSSFILQPLPSINIKFIYLVPFLVVVFFSLGEVGLIMEPFFLLMFRSTCRPSVCPATH